MSLQPYSMFIFLGGAMLLSLLGAVCLQVDGNRSWRRKAHGSRIVFSPPLSFRVIVMVLGGSFLLFPLLVTSTTQKPLEGWLSLLIVVLIYCSASGMLLWSAGMKRKLSLDTQNQAYCFSHGWWLKPVTKKGSLQDFEGVFMQCHSGHDTQICTVGLSWKQGTGGDNNAAPILGRFRDRSKADDFVREITRMLNLSVVAPPTRRSTHFWKKRGNVT